MTITTEHPIRTGGDPRTLAEFAALRDELGKLTHPARPDVDWLKVEQLCLALFRQNGVELQSAAWFTLARAHNNRLAGMEEGLALIDGLLSHQWPGLWPLQTHARMDILSWLTARLQQVLRTRDYHYGDLAVIYRTETLLERMNKVLEQLELKHLSKLDGLRQQVHNTALRLESLELEKEPAEAPPEPPLTLTSAPEPEQPPLVYVVNASPVSSPFSTPEQPLPEVQPDNVAEPSAFTSSAVSSGQRAEQPVVTLPIEPVSQPIEQSPPQAIRPATHWRSFAAGVVMTAILGAAGIWGWQTTQSPPANNVLLASVAPLPQALSPAALTELRSEPGGKLASLQTEVLSATQERLAQLATLLPLWAVQQGSQLAQQAQTLWPDAPASHQLVQDWQQHLAAQALPVAQLNDWYLAQDRLQQLANKLNSLDEKRGRYMTVSELKSAVFAIQQPLLSSPPLEELLRQLAEQQRLGKVSPALTTQIDTRLNQLLNRYALLVSGVSSSAETDMK